MAGQRTSQERQDELIQAFQTEHPELADALEIFGVAEEISAAAAVPAEESRTVVGGHTAAV